MICSAIAFWLIVTRAASPLQASWPRSLHVSRRRSWISRRPAWRTRCSHLLLAAVLRRVPERRHRRGRAADARSVDARGSALSHAARRRVDRRARCSRSRPGSVGKPASVPFGRRGLAPGPRLDALRDRVLRLPVSEHGLREAGDGHRSRGAARQGLLYLLDSLDRDPITLTRDRARDVVAAFQRSSAPARSRGRPSLYRLRRLDRRRLHVRPFPRPAGFAAVAHGSAANRRRKLLWGRSPASRWLSAVTGTHLPLWSNSSYGDAAPKPSGIVDERAVYFHDRSLALAKRGTFRDPDWPSRTRKTGRINVVNTCGLMGAAGIDFGPVHSSARRVRARRPAAREAARRIQSRMANGPLPPDDPAGYRKPRRIRQSAAGSRASRLRRAPAAHHEVGRVVLPRTPASDCGDEYRQIRRAHQSRTTIATPD